MSGKTNALPTVSVCMITFNHDRYIAQAIEGVLMQQTDFSIELVIGEDCSTDRTREICIEYQQKYPNIIRLLLNEKNIGMMANFVQTLEACKGKYIALCEGDDYWTDPRKLQKQEEFLEENSEISLYGHNCIIYDGIGNCTGIHLTEKKRDKYKNQQRWDINKILINYPFFTATVMIRNKINFEDFYKFDCTYNCDVILYWLSALTGDIFIDFDLIGAVRNYLSTGAGSKIEKNKKEYYKVLLYNLEKLAELDSFNKINERDYLESYEIVLGNIKEHDTYFNMLKRFFKGVRRVYFKM